VSRDFYRRNSYRDGKKMDGTRHARRTPPPTLHSHRAARACLLSHYNRYSVATSITMSRTEQEPPSPDETLQSAMTHMLDRESSSRFDPDKHSLTLHAHLRPTAHARPPYTVQYSAIGTTHSCMCTCSCPRELELQLHACTSKVWLSWSRLEPWTRVWVWVKVRVRVSRSSQSHGLRGRRRHPPDLPSSSCAHSSAADRARGM